MYLYEEELQQEYYRNSKLGKRHKYYRISRVVIFRCDSCSDIFQRPRGKMDPKRISNDFFHCCDNCDSKRFAQRKGVEWKKVWELDASSNLDISKL